MRVPPVYFVKLGLATALAYLLCHRLGSDYPFYAVISVIVVLQPTVGTTIASGLRRTVGTLVGSLLGGALAGAHVPAAPATGLGVATTVFICTRAGLRDGVSVSAFALISIVLNHPSQPWDFAAERFRDTVVGILVALVVNRTLWPARAGAQLRGLLSAYFHSGADLLGRVMQSYFRESSRGEADLEPLRQSLRAVSLEGPALWKEARREHADGWVGEGSEFLIKRLSDHLGAIDQAVGESLNDPLPIPCEVQLRQLSSHCVAGLQALAQGARIDTQPLHLAASALREQPAPDDRQGQALMRYFVVAYNLQMIAAKLVHFLESPA